MCVSFSLSPSHPPPPCLQRGSRPHLHHSTRSARGADEADQGQCNESPPGCSPYVRWCCRYELGQGESYHHCHTHIPANQVMTVGQFRSYSDMVTWGIGIILYSLACVQWVKELECYKGMYLHISPLYTEPGLKHLFFVYIG